jgi:predicted RNase H-like HicB family nuclease
MRQQTNKVKRELDYFLHLPYTVILKSEEAGGFFAEIEELPGCMSQGDTAQEAVNNIQEAKRLWLETALENSIEIPLPLSKQEYSGKLLIRIPKTLHKRLSSRANKEAVSLNQMICSLLSERISTQELVYDIKAAIKPELSEMVRGYIFTSLPNVMNSTENVIFKKQKYPQDKWVKRAG